MTHTLHRMHNYQLMSRIKRARQQQILRLVSAEPVCSQEQLRERLLGFGYDVTQATLSRDLKELRIVKAVDPAGAAYRYQALERPDLKTPRVGVSGNLIVIHTERGMAAALAYEIDALDLPDLLGTVAGEDTILAIVAEGFQARDVEQKLWNILNA